MEWILNIANYQLLFRLEVSASGWSLVQRSPTECGVSECDREALILRRPWPTRGCCTTGKKLSTGFQDVSFKYVIWFLQREYDRDFALLGCYAVYWQLLIWFETAHRFYLRECSLTAESGTGRFSLNVGKQLQTHAASQLRRVKNSTTGHWRLKPREIRLTKRKTLLMQVKMQISSSNF